MTTKELIKILKILDPDGDIEISVMNDPILVIEKIQAGFDGPQKIISNMENLHIKKMKITDRNDKIRLVPITVKEALMDNEDIEFEIDVIEELEPKIKNKIEKLRKKIKDENILFKKIFNKKDQ